MRDEIVGILQEMRETIFWLSLNSWNHRPKKML